MKKYFSLLFASLFILLSVADSDARRIFFNKASTAKYLAVGNKLGAEGGNNSVGTLGDGSHAGATSRVSVRSPATSYINLSCAFTNWRVTSTGETNGANILNVKAAIELGGATYPFYFGGARTYGLAVGETIWSDPIIVTVPASTQYFIRTFGSVTLGQTWPISRAGAVANGEGSNYSSSIAPGTDIVDQTGVIAGSGTSGYVYSASGCVGTPATDIASVYVIGDSIAVGAGEIGAGVFGDADGYTSYLERGLGSSVHWQTATRSSSTTSSFNDFFTKRKALAQNAIFTHAVSEYGTNDVYGSGLSLAQTQVQLITSWNNLLTVAPKVIQTTIAPRTTSTDGWVTTVNQTIVSPAASNVTRVAVNTWLRDGAPMLNGVAVATGTVGALRAGVAGHPLFKVWDAALIAETSLNSGIWKVTGGSWTTDGIHPVVLGDTNMQACVIIADLAL